MKTWKTLILTALFLFVVWGTSSHSITASSAVLEDWCDADEDGFCAIPFGTDCDDHDPLTYPGATERTDLKDNNCSGFGDEPPVGFTRQD